MKRIIMVLGVCLFLILSGCNDQEAVNVEVLQLNAYNIQTIGDQVVYTLDGDVKQASYSKYVFDLDEFNDLVGDLNGSIEVTIDNYSEETYKGEPLSQSPSEGYLIKTYECKIIKGN